MSNTQDKASLHPNKNFCVQTTLNMTFKASKWLSFVNQVSQQRSQYDVAAMRAPLLTHRAGIAGDHRYKRQVASTYVFSISICLEGARRGSAGQAHPKFETHEQETEIRNNKTRKWKRQVQKMATNPEPLCTPNRASAAQTYIEHQNELKQFAETSASTSNFKSDTTK